MSRLGSIVGVASAANLYCPEYSDFQVEGGVSWQGSPDGAGWTITGSGAVRGKTSFNMIGGYMEFDLDNDRATTGMNNNLYTISPSHQYNSFNDYCDAQGPAGSSPTGTNCIEMDIWEANGNCAVQAAWHTWFNKAGDCDRDGCAVEADIGGKIHVRADFGIDGEMHIYYDGKEMTDYHPKPSNAAKQSVADTFNAVGATIVSTQWHGWGPHESKCKDNGDNPGSSFSISNLKVSGTVLMGPTPSRCSGSPTPPPPSPQPTPPTPPSPTPCTAADTDPWGTGSEVPCCDGLQKVLKNWDGDGNKYYKCVSTPSPSPRPTPQPTPPSPTPCTAANRDPWVTGSEVPCCQGLQKELKNWDGDGNKYYKCVATPSPSPRPTPPPTPPSPTPCTAANRNPWVTGSEVPCCDGLQKVVKNWDGDGNYYYKCVATPSPTPEPTPSPTPSPPPTPPSPTPCTAADRDPFGTGSEVPCCNSLQKVLKNWDGDGNYYYKCVATPSPTPEPTPSPRPSPPPPTPKPSPAGGKCCWGGCSGDCHSDTYCDASENQCSDNCSGQWCAASFEVVV